VKKCASCTKDLPDAALHCVFCGARQPPAPAVQQGLARTAGGPSASDAAAQARRQSALAATVQAPVYKPPQRQAPPTSPPPKGPGYPAPGQPAGFAPVSSANAATLFVPSGPMMPPQAPQPGMPPPPPPAYGRQNQPAASLPTLVPSPPPPLGQPPRPLQPPPPAPQPSQPQVPIMRIPAAQPPPYLLSQTASRSIRPLEPWRGSLRFMMFLWGIALLAAFAAPLRTSPALRFHWDLILESGGTARLPPLMLAAIGVLSVIVAAIPMQSVARGLIAALLGLAGIAVPIALVGMPPWQGLVSMTGMLLLVPSLLVRNEYREALIPRFLVTLGALGILVPYLLPQGGAIPLVSVVKTLIDVPGAAKLEPALKLGLITVVVMSLLAWLPGPVTGAAKFWAWFLILWALITHVAALLVAGDLGNLGDTVMATPNATLMPWISGGGALGSAYLVLVGYGLASVLGKRLE
jgi:hypothetical protein